MTFEVSRDNATTWRSVTLTRNDSTNEFSGVLKFTDFAEETYSNITTIASNTTGIQLNATTQKSLSQAFVLTVPRVINEFRIETNKTGTPGGAITFSISKDNAGNPGTPIVSLQRNLSAIGAGTTTQTFTIPKITLPVGTYHIVVDTDSGYKDTFNGSNNLQIRSNGSAVSNFAKAFDTSWTNVANNTIGFRYDFKNLSLLVRMTASAAASVSGFGIQYGEQLNFVEFKKFQSLVVGNAQQVAIGLATHSSLQDAISSAGNNTRIKVLTCTITENVTLSQSDVTIEGDGRNSVLSGDLTISGNNVIIEKMRITGDVTISGNSNFLDKVWLSNSSNLTDNGENNSITGILE
jgi:hypothetical protein